MIVVADSGPIHYLVLIGDINVLLPLFDRVLIPEAVHSELNQPATPAVVRQWVTNLPQWAEIHQVQPASEGSLQKLGPGEQEAILLARQIAAEYLLIDDARGRFLAETQRVRTIGTLGILRSAATNGLLNFRRSFDKLTGTNFRISSSLRKQILEEFEAP
jgi:predicted nucleic acid-binding protein